ncbi:glycoside hydrolase family 36 protein [Xylariaceae sp. FL1019]|nr:glycoside hydrolase family 36 protein [Xylariaceae sp. FL1019]
MGPGILRLTTYPPLGQVTQPKSNEVLFSAILQVDDTFAENPWQLALWHSGGASWKETLLSPIPASESPPFLQSTNQNGKLIHFSTTIHVASSLQFTFKFRSDSTQAWTWAGHGVDDGLILIPNDGLSPSEDNLSDVIHNLNSDLSVRSIFTQTPRTKLWQVNAPVASAEGHDSTYADVELGVPWGGCQRYFALVRHATPWLGPRHGKADFNLDKDAFLCSFLSPKGKHLVVLGASGKDGVQTLFRSGESGLVKLHIRNDSEKDTAGRILVAVGDDAQSAIAAAMYHARVMVLASANEDEPSFREQSDLEDGVGTQWRQYWYDGLGYCTWNSLGQDLSEEKLLSALEDFKNNDIHITNLIIDDNWQDIDRSASDPGSYGWNRFEAEPKGFPKGLKHTVSQIKIKYPNISYVAVWHALLGYWGGIAPNGELAQKYQTVQVKCEDGEASTAMTVVDKTDVSSFYDDFYRFLASCGIDGVKTDAQFKIDTWASAKLRRELTLPYLDAWTLSSLRHFHYRVISCMSQTPQILFHQQIPTYRPVIAVRNSDDFFPDVPASHPWHLWANAHNALLTHHLNVLPDWDMFQTKHEFAGFHAAARCLSGGPIYITDIPGEHDMDLIKQLIGRTPRNNTVTLRPTVVGRSVNVYTGFDEDVLLKIGAYHGAAATGSPILGLFNTRPHELVEIVPLDIFPGVTDSIKYVVRSHQSGMVSSVIGTQSQGARIAVDLPPAGYDIFSAFPVTQFESETNGLVSVACLGLIGKMTGAASIISNRFEQLATGRVTVVSRLKTLGKLGLYISSLPDMSIERDLLITIQGQPIPVTVVEIDDRDEHVLVVDTETAWEEMNLVPGWSNEVEIKTYIDIEHL